MARILYHVQLLEDRLPVDLGIEIYFILECEDHKHRLKEIQVWRLVCYVLKSTYARNEIQMISVGVIHETFKLFRYNDAYYFHFLLLTLFYYFWCTGIA